MPIRITGPYAHRGKYRCRVTTAPGAHTWAPTGATADESRELAEEVAAGFQERMDLTVGGLVERYLRHLAALGRKANTIADAREKFRWFLADWRDREAGRITDRQAKERYLEATERLAAASHRTALVRCRGLWAWARQEGLVRANPWEAVRPIGKPRRGKPQLRIDEARKLVAHCEALAPTDDTAVAVLMAILMGLRSSEISSRVVRDIDDNGRYLIVPDSKTEAGKRPLELPEQIRDVLRSRTAGRGPEELLLRKSNGKPAGKGFVRYSVRKHCLLAGVPVVCAHALRGQVASLAYEAGALPHLIAAMLGHRSSSVTEQHYATRESVADAAQRSRLQRLKGPPN